MATRVADTVASPMSRTMLPLITASADDQLDTAATGYWASRFDHPQRTHPAPESEM